MENYYFDSEVGGFYDLASDKISLAAVQKVKNLNALHLSESAQQCSGNGRKKLPVSS